MYSRPAPSPCILVTGVTGFIGRWVARYFTSLGYQVVGIGTAPPENAPLASLHAYYSLRLPDDQLQEILHRHQPQICLHCAGRASVGLSFENPRTDFYQNTAIVFETLNHLRQVNPQCRFVFLSSAAVYGNPAALPIREQESQPNPLSPYGFHKLQGEQITTEFSRIYGMPTASVRIFSAYGPGLRRQVLWDICYKVLIDKSLHLQGTGAESRDFIHVADVARALALVAENAPLEGEVYNLAAGQEITIRSLADLTLTALQRSVEVVFDSQVALGNPVNWRADIAKIQALGFTPQISLETGVQAFADWCKADLQFL